MKKRGQLTAFIAIGLVILVILGLFFYMKEQVIEEELEAQMEVPEFAVPVQTYLESCIEDVAEQGIFVLGYSGGYYNTPFESSIFYVDHDVPYFYLDGNSLVPSAETLQEELASYMEDNFQYCINNLDTFTEQGFELDVSSYSFSSLLQDDQVSFTVSTNLKLQKEDESTTLSVLFAEVPTKIKRMLSTAEQIVEEYEQKPGYICLDCYDELATETGFELRLDPVYDKNIYLGENDEIILPENDIVWVHIMDPENSYESDLMYGQYQLAFVMDYALEQEQEFDIVDIPDLDATAGYNFTYQVQTTQPAISFSDSSELFDITEDGLITFTPGLEDIGTYIIEIYADSEEETDNEYFQLNILDINTPPVLDYIGYHTATSGEVFTLTITATDEDDVMFTDDSDLFDIGLYDGVISFTPDTEQTGNYQIEIKAVDTKGSASTQTLYLVIT